MGEFLVRFAQSHESFRLPELKALAAVEGIEMQVVDYSKYSPFCIIRLNHPSISFHSSSRPSAISLAKALISRCILAQSIHELWGSSTSYQGLHSYVQTNASHFYSSYRTFPFKFKFDSFGSSRTITAQREIIESFSWLGFKGPIVLKGEDVEILTVFEEWEHDPNHPSYQRDSRQKDQQGRESERASSSAEVQPKRIYFGRLISLSGRSLTNIYTLKKRAYLSTTSMDAELALIMANLTHARPGTLFYDPFVGTGSLTVACAHFGAYVWGSDIDGRALRGVGKGSKGDKGVKENYEQYGLSGRDLGGLAVDLVNGGWRGWSGPREADKKRGEEYERKGEWLDGIVCDPPYGVREGLRVLGSRDGEKKEAVYLSDGVAAHLKPGYVPPKKPYSFTALLNDLLSFAAATLVSNGRLSFWMPSANDEDQTLAIPKHPRLDLVSSCVQPFNKWSRRLLTYRKLRPEEANREVGADDEAVEGEVEGKMNGLSIEDTGADDGELGRRANDQNAFRRRYFQGFKSLESAEAKQREEN